jgi:ribosome-associated translation inhibitor RaiA
MNLDVMTERVVMQPAWYREIERWVAHCARHHPGIVGLELTLRHDGRAAEDEVSVVATGRDHCLLRAAAHATLMADALHEALDTIDHDLLVHDAIEPR